ncbi:uncharacterized protein LOC120625049 [Pararge aegeria]|uniref:uncharacterized protein LOC120625049 n=1 Tax=Pararge aegeria TaxID=116150 RepID=UPI0019D20849|nr:uncharacterized protein LOC120625049 [Pararge aegeria]
MVCYPIILLIAGLKQHDISSTLTSTLNHLFVNCKNTENSVYPIPSALPGPESFKLHNYHHEKETDEYEDDHYHESNAKYFNNNLDKSLFSEIKDNLKEIITHYNPRDKKSENIFGNDLKSEATLPVYNKNNEKQMNRIGQYFENLNSKIIEANSADEKPQLRSRNKLNSIAIPTIDDIKSLIQILKQKIPLQSSFF